MPLFLLSLPSCLGCILLLHHLPALQVQLGVAGGCCKYASVGSTNTNYDFSCSLASHFPVINWDVASVVTHASQVGLLHPYALWSWLHHDKHWHSWWTVQTGDISLIEYLLQNGAKWDKTDPYGRTPLHYCILHEHPQAAKQLLKRYAFLVHIANLFARTCILHCSVNQCFFKLAWCLMFILPCAVWWLKLFALHANR